MPPYKLLLSLFITSRALANADTSPVEDYDVLQYINPLIGSANGGKFEPNKFNLMLTTNSPQEMCFQVPHYHMAWRNPSPTQTQEATKEGLLTRVAALPDSPACTTPALEAVLR